MKIPLPTTQKILDQYYAVKYKGKIVSYLNPRFAARKKVTVEGLRKIQNTHRKILGLFDKIRQEDDSVKLHKMAERVTELDYELQAIWGFERDVNFHTWWFKAPKCACAKMDNTDFIGTPYNSVNESCPLHGKISV